MKVSAINYLIDAGPLVGLLDAVDQWHDWSSKVFASLGDVQFATTETALAEACHLLGFNRAAVINIISHIDSGLIVPVSSLSESPGRIRRLMEKYPRMDLGDATLVVLSERIPNAKLITMDTKDFSVYRRADGTAVPCIMPKA